MDRADPVLAQVVRSGFVESEHRGRVVALGPDGDVLLAAGDPVVPVLLRSCAKPLQAVAMLRAGLDLDGAHLAVACASHDGTDQHLRLVREVLWSVDLDESALDNTASLALEPEAAARQVLGGGADRLHHNCSGKHAAMVATCVVNRWPTSGYLEASHPLQQRVLATIEELCDAPVEAVAVDGCGAPIAAVALTGLARAFSRLATADPATAEGRVAAAMRAHPVVVGGVRRDVTRIMRAVPGLLAKDGAEGCFAVAAPDGTAVAVKVGDGAARAAVPVAVAALRQAVVTDAAMEELAAPPVLGHGRPVGSIRVVVPFTGSAG